MMKWMRQLPAVSGWMIMACLALVPSPAQAQHALARAVLPASDVNEAEVLENRASQLLDDYTRWGEAMVLYRQAAALRPAGDPQAVEDLRIAARLAFYSGDAARAVVDLQGAAAQALVSGSPFLAAHTYLDAAWVAGRSGMEAERTHFLAQASSLTRIEKLTREERRSIERRLEGDPSSGL
jgi:hypothetical protein